MHNINKKSELKKIIEKASKQEKSMKSTEDIYLDLIILANGLREKGFTSEAQNLEDKIFQRKQAETHLYKAIEDEHILDKAHPEGNVEVAPSSKGYGVVETQQGAKKKIEDIVGKNPTGKFAYMNKKAVGVEISLLSANLTTLMRKKNVGVIADDLVQIFLEKYLSKVADKERFEAIYYNVFEDELDNYMSETPLEERNRDNFEMFLGEYGWALDRYLQKESSVKSNIISNAALENAGKERMPYPTDEKSAELWITGGDRLDYMINAQIFVNLEKKPDVLEIEWSTDTFSTLNTTIAARLAYGEGEIDNPVSKIMYKLIKMGRNPAEYWDLYKSKMLDPINYRNEDVVADPKATQYKVNADLLHKRVIKQIPASSVPLLKSKVKKNKIKEEEVVFKNLKNMIPKGIKILDNTLGWMKHAAEVTPNHKKQEENGPYKWLENQSYVITNVYNELMDNDLQSKEPKEAVKLFCKIVQPLIPLSAKKVAISDLTMSLGFIMKVSSDVMKQIKALGIKVTGGALNINFFKKKAQDETITPAPPPPQQQYQPPPGSDKNSGSRRRSNPMSGKPAPKSQPPSGSSSYKGSLPTNENVRLMQRALHGLEEALRVNETYKVNPSDLSKLINTGDKTGSTKTDGRWGPNTRIALRTAERLRTTHNLSSTRLDVYPRGIDASANHNIDVINEMTRNAGGTPRGRGKPGEKPLQISIIDHLPPPELSDNNVTIIGKNVLRTSDLRSLYVFVKYLVSKQYLHLVNEAPVPEIIGYEAQDLEDVKKQPGGYLLKSDIYSKPIYSDEPKKQPIYFTTTRGTKVLTEGILIINLSNILAWFQDRTEYLVNSAATEQEKITADIYHRYIGNIIEQFRTIKVPKTRSYLTVQEIKAGSSTISVTSPGATDRAGVGDISISKTDIRNLRLTNEDFNRIVDAIIRRIDDSSSRRDIFLALKQIENEYFKRTRGRRPRGRGYEGREGQTGEIDAGFRAYRNDLPFDYTVHLSRPYFINDKLKEVFPWSIDRRTFQMDSETLKDILKGAKAAGYELNKQQLERIQHLAIDKSNIGKQYGRAYRKVAPNGYVYLEVPRTVRPGVLGKPLKINPFSDPTMKDQYERIKSIEESKFLTENVLEDFKNELDKVAREWLRSSEVNQAVKERKGPRLIEHLRQWTSYINQQIRNLT